MHDPVLSLLRELRSRSVEIAVVDQRLRYRSPRGAISASEKKLLSDYAEAIRAIHQPDRTLPDELYIPARCRTLEEIKECIDSQRIKKAA